MLRHWFAPQKVPTTIAGAEALGIVPGIVPLEASNALLHTLRELADHYDRGFLVEQVMQLIV